MPDISKRLEKAEKYLQKGKMEDALDEFQSALDDDPENNGIRERAADLCISMNKSRLAASHLSVLFDRLAEANDQAKAVLTYKKLARIGAPSIEQASRCANFVEKTNKKEALELLQHAADGFAAMGQKKEAMAVFKRMLALDPSPENWKREAELATELGDSKSAAQAFFQVGELEQKAKGNAHPWYERAYAADRTHAEAALAYSRSLLERADAAQALKIIEPFSKKQDSAAPFREIYARALLQLKRAAEAEPIIWQLYEKDSKRIDDVVQLINALLESRNEARALAITKRACEAENKGGRQRDFISRLKGVADHHNAGTEFLEYMVTLFNSANREHDYCETLTKLFDLYYAARNYRKAGDSLDAAAEVDPYEPGHQKRLELLRGKIDANRLRAIANRFTNALKAGGEIADHEVVLKPVAESEPTMLEDFMLQAEIFLQYSMRSKAVERLERIQKLFPGEEEKNEKLHSLYMNAGIVPKYENQSVGKSAQAKAGAASADMATTASMQAQTLPAAVVNENSVDNIARVTEITRNIYRQANVKGVLFAAVNDIGRHWNASRCVAGLCTPGKPPSAALEYCAPGVKQSEVMAIVKLIATLQALAAGKGPVAITNVKNAPELAPIQQYVATLKIESVLAVPLMDGEEPVGILILQQCGAQRSWRQTDVLVLKTIADQMVLAVNNAKLRNLMKTLAVTDEKSGLLKRASYIDVLLSDIRRGLEQSSPSSVMLLHFGKASALVKEIGETAVETMMQQVGQICCGHIRQNDVAVRYDLTTIALVLADTNDKNAFFVVDKLRKVFNNIKVPGTDRSPSCAVGIAEAVMLMKFDPIDIVTEVINRVERALEAARAEGGNKARSLAPVLEAAAVA